MPAPNSSGCTTFSANQVVRIDFGVTNNSADRFKNDDLTVSLDVGAEQQTGPVALHQLKPNRTAGGSITWTLPSSTGLGGFQLDLSVSDGDGNVVAHLSWCGFTASSGT